ncbi:MAG: hypothetical protein H7X71_05240 [Chitinophagales bacterium]|nr:hypothetical protein [Chitinophagales bacterium]
MKNRYGIILTYSTLLIIASCKKNEIPVIPEDITDTFSATPLTEDGNYKGLTTVLGTTNEHASNAPVIIPINGKIGFVVLGASNSKYEGDVLIQKVNAREVHEDLVVRNCATSSKDINDWIDPDNACWYNALNLLGDLQPEEVQIVWFQTDDLMTTSTLFPDEPLALKEKIIEAVDLMKETFPNLKQVYGSGRSYTGYAEALQHQEPKGYYTGWSWKWVVEDQIHGILPLDMPWISDEIYLWTDEEQIRSDGFQMLEEDYMTGGVHLTERGNEKVADYIIERLQTMESSSYWFNP